MAHQLRHVAQAQRGLALITAILVVALVAVAVATLALRTDRRRQQWENQRDRYQARILARSAIELARLSLEADGKQSRIDTPNEAWTVPIEGMKVEQGSLGGSIEEAQGRFNLNQLLTDGELNPWAAPVLQRLLQPAQINENWVLSLADWMDADGVARVPGSERRKNGQPAPNQSLERLEELEDLPETSTAVWSVLRRHCTVLPKPTRINIHFASEELLLAVMPELQMAGARTLVQRLKQEPVADMEALRSKLPEDLQKRWQDDPDFKTRIENNLTFSSRYFWVHTHADYGHAHVALRSLVERGDDNRVQVLWVQQEYGGA